MGERKCWRRRPGQAVVAVQLRLVTEGFRYQKWGGEQQCKANDWVVDNGGEVYTVDADSFARTYTALGQGRYEKTGKVWAEQALGSGRVDTKEGRTAYKAGDWLVSNEADGSDAYAVDAETFEKQYEPDA
ncbi:hypothetical protein ACS5PK_11010 [Roseateles sp. DB2]|uniref:hypothetical protein n=1 Tax=Roseateles sp. DB2 TaxID=3453717 RepID=UPI003EE8C004